MSRLIEIDTAVQELRVERHRDAFIRTLSRVVAGLGEIPDWPRAALTADQMIRVRELAEETVDAVERRVESGADDERTQQQLAGTVYEIRRRMEAAETWFRHFAG